MKVSELIEKIKNHPNWYVYDADMGEYGNSNEVHLAIFPPDIYVIRFLRAEEQGGISIE